MKYSASDHGTDKKKHQISHFLSIGNQMSMETGPLYMDRERFEVGYAVKQLLP